MHNITMNDGHSIPVVGYGVYQMSSAEMDVDAAQQ